MINTKNCNSVKKQWLALIAGKNEYTLSQTLPLFRYLISSSQPNHSPLFSLLPKHPMLTPVVAPSSVS